MNIITKGTNKKGLAVNISIMDVDVFKEFIKLTKRMVDDKRIDRKVREEYRIKFLKLTEDETVPVGPPNNWCGEEPIKK